MPVSDASVVRSAPKGRRAFPLDLVALTAVSAICSFALLDLKSFWFDEGVSLYFATTDWPTLWSAIHHMDAVLALYYAVLHVWLAAFGPSEAAARALSTLSATLSVPLVYSATRQLIDRRTALVAALLLASSLFFAQYAGEARPYALELCVSAAGTWTYLFVLRKPRPIGFIAYGVAMTALIYIHAFGAFLLLAHMMTLPLLRSDWKTLAARFAAVLAAIVACCLPLAVLQSEVGTSQIDWIPAPKMSDIGNALIAFAGSRLRAIVEAALCVLAFLPFAHAPKRRPIVAIALWTAVPMALLYALSLEHPAFVPRYLMPSFPAFIMLVAAGITSIRNTVVVALITSALVLSSVRSVYQERDRPAEEYRAAAAFLTEHAGPTDGIVVFIPSSIYALSAELRHRGGSSALSAPVLYPAADYAIWSDQGKSPPLPAEAGLAGRSHLWLVLRDDDGRHLNDAVTERLSARYTQGSVTTFKRVAVMRFDPK